MLQDDQCIFIVGENILQNALLAAYLKDSVGAECICKTTLEGASRHKTEESVKNIVLIDCFAMNKDALLTLVGSDSLGKVAYKRPTLFNLHAKMSIEPTALRSGIRGFFYRDDSLAALTKGIVALFNNDYWVSRKILVDFLSGADISAIHAIRFPNLTGRESELVTLLVQGLSNQTIADRLFISIPTVKSHLSNIYRKINVMNRLQAVCWAEKILTSGVNQSR